MSHVDSAKADAYHEAGHAVAVAAVVLGTGLVDVDIRSQRVPGGGIGRAGANLVRPQDRDILGRGEDAVLPLLVTLIAGWTAEKRVSRDAPFEHIHPHSDGYMVRRYAIGAVCTPVSDGGRIVLRAEEFVVRHGTAIDAVASELLANEVLSAAQVAAIVAANLPA